MLRFFCATTLIVALTALSGCGDSGPAIVPVSGVVMIDGQPLTSGFVMVAPQGQRAASGTIGPDGRFTLTTKKPNDGCYVGTHTVMVTATETINDLSRKWLAPEKYADAAKSGLTLTITEATENAKLELTWAGGKPYVEKFEKE